MNGASNRRRGAKAEVMVVNYLRARGYPDARRYLAGDGRQPGDIDAIPGLCIEVRDRASSSWPSWCRDAERQAGDRAWVVVRRLRGNPDVAQWPCKAVTKWGTSMAPRSPTWLFGEYLDWWEDA